MRKPRMATVTATSGAASATASVTVKEWFYLAANDVTVICSSADVGETGDVGGVVYTKRSKAQIDALVDGGDYASLATTCTSSVMDMSFANQALSSEYLVKNRADLSPGVYPVPKDLDKEVGRLKLKAMGIEIDILSPAQQKYLESW